MHLFITEFDASLGRAPRYQGLTVFELDTILLQVVAVVNSCTLICSTFSQSLSILSVRVNSGTVTKQYIRWVEIPYWTRFAELGIASSGNTPGHKTANETFLNSYLSKTIGGVRRGIRGVQTPPNLKRLF